MKSWKDLFVKNEEPDAPKQETASGTEAFSFPVAAATPNQPPAVVPNVTDPIVAEVMKVYESGLDSINMPGYDFYEFYQTVISTGNPAEQTFTMAFQMGRTLDKTITPSKLLTDAEFYISKINEVHGQYVSQGQLKLAAIQEKKTGEKNALQSDVEAASQRINQLRAELQQLEQEVNQKRGALLKVDDGYYPQEKVIREKLAANDIARKTSIDKLNMIKEGIQRYIK